MSKRALKKSKRRRSRAVVPALGITGLSLSQRLTWRYLPSGGELPWLADSVSSDI